MPNGHGGYRPGSGRKPGSRTKKTVELARAAAEQGVSPLEVLLFVMRHHFEEERYSLAAQVARDAAPYVHPRLSAMQVTGKDEGPVSVTIVGGIDLAAVVGQRQGLHTHARIDQPAEN